MAEEDLWTKDRDPLHCETISRIGYGRSTGGRVYCLGTVGGFVGGLFTMSVRAKGMCLRQYWDAWLALVVSTMTRLTSSRHWSRFFREPCREAVCMLTIDSALITKALLTGPSCTQPAKNAFQFGIKQTAPERKVL